MKLMTLARLTPHEIVDRVTAVRDTQQQPRYYGHLLILTLWRLYLLLLLWQQSVQGPLRSSTSLRMAESAKKSQLASGSLQKGSWGKTARRHWEMFKGREPHEGTDQVCLGPRWVPGSQQTLHFSDNEMNGEGPDILCLSEMPSEKVTSAGLKRALPSARRGSGWGRGSYRNTLTAQGPDVRLTDSRPGHQCKHRVAALGLYWG